MSKLGYFFTGLLAGTVLMEVGHGLYLHNSDYYVAAIMTIVLWVLATALSEGEQ